MESRPRPSRSYATAMGIVVAALALLTLVSGLAIWANEVVFDSSRFAETAVDVMRSPEGNGALGDAIWDYVKQRFPPVSIVSDQVGASSIQRVLARPQAEELLAVTAVNAHLAVTGPEPIDIFIDLSQDYRMVIGTLIGMDSSLIESLPPIEALGNIVLVPAAQVPRADRLHRLVGWLAPFLWCVVALSMAAVLAFGRERRLAVAFYGFALAAVAAGALALVYAGAGKAIGSISDSRIGLLVEEGYRGLVGGVVLQAYVMLALGVVLAAGGTWLWRRER